MKKSLFTKIGAIALGLGLLVTGGVSIAHTNVNEAKAAEAGPDTDGYYYDSIGTGSISNKIITWSLANNNIIITQNKGSGADPSGSYLTDPRVYMGNYLYFSASGTYRIHKIEINYSTTYYGNSMTAGTAISDTTVTDDQTNVSRNWSTKSGGTHTITSAAEDGLQTIYLQNTYVKSGKQLRIVSGGIKVYYTKGEDANKPSLEISNKPTGTLNISDTGTFTATAKNATNPVITWSSNNETVLNVTTSGAYTAVNAGLATVTASLACDELATALEETFDVTVLTGLVASINIIPGSVYLPVGGTKVVSLNALPSTAIDKTVTWLLSDVNPSGSVTWDSSTLTLTGVSEGTAKLTATTNDGSNISKSIDVNVINAYDININSSKSDTGSLTTTTIKNYLTSDVTLTYSTVTYIYPETENKLKFNKSDAAGIFKFSVASVDNYLIDKVIILGQGYGDTDTANVSVNESEEQKFSADNMEYYVFDIDNGLDVNISGTTTSKGRFYISEILLVKIKSSTPLVAIDNAPSSLTSLAKGTFTATVTNATTYTIAWTSSDTNVIEVQNDGSYVTGEAGKATITATITVNGVQYSDTADIVVLEHDGLSAANAFTTTEAKLVIDNNLKVSGKTYYVTGTISEIADAWSDTYNNVTYTITDGTTEFKLYRMSAIVDPGLAVNSTVTAYAAASKLVLYNTTYELNGCTYADPDCTEVEDFIDAYMHMTDYDTKFDNSEGTGACSGENGYYADAKAYFNDMTSRQRSVFVTGTDYAKAYARLQAWATANGEVFGTDNVLGAATSGSQLLKLANENNAAVIIVMVTAMAASLAAAFYFMLRKKKAQ